MLPYRTPTTALLRASVALGVWLGLAGCAVTQTAAPAPGIESRPPAASNINVALGIPTDADPSDDLILDHDVFVVSYNARKRVPNWVAWRLVAEDLGTAHRTNNFHADALLPADLFRVGPLDYRGSGYDRSHMCPSGDRTSSVSANAATFVMTNMQPHAHALNIGPWARLEAYERELARQPGKQVFIVAGGLFDTTTVEQVIGPGIAVPRATYKVLVVLDAGQGATDVSAGTIVFAVIMPNVDAAAGVKWQQYLVSVDEVERESGYDFLPRVADATQRVVEARLLSAPQ